MNENMFKNFLAAKLYVSSVCVTFLVLSSSSYAEIYKWIDENGQTHYSDKRVNAGRLATEKIEVEPSQNLIQKVASPSSKLKNKKHDPRGRLADRQDMEIVFSMRAPKPVTDPCKLARKIISGEVKLSNGLPTGKHEIEVAKRDISKFCN